MISLVLAIAGIVLSFFLPIVAIILLIISLILGIIGIKKKEKYAKAATIISAIVLALNIIGLIVSIIIGVGQYNNAKDQIDKIWDKVEETK